MICFLHIYVCYQLSLCLAIFIYIYINIYILVLYVSGVSVWFLCLFSPLKLCKCFFWKEGRKKETKEENLLRCNICTFYMETNKFATPCYSVRADGTMYVPGMLMYAVTSLTNHSTLLGHLMQVSSFHWLFSVMCLNMNVLGCYTLLLAQ